MGDVTQGPETFVRKPVVVTGLLFRGYPDTANLIRGMLRRHTHMAARVHDIPIGRSVAMCDPHPGTGTHDRLQRRDQSACRYLHFDLLISPVVDIRLAVGHNEHLVTGELFVKYGLEAGRGP